MTAHRVLAVTLALAFVRPFCVAEETTADQAQAAIDQAKAAMEAAKDDASLAAKKLELNDAKANLEKLQAQAAEAKDLPPVEQTIAQAKEQDDGEADETKQLLAQLTISMTSEVSDARHFTIRDSAGRGKKTVRLGNTAGVERGSLDEAEHQERLKAGTDLLSKLVAKQMVWWKAAPDDQQPAAPTDGSDTIVVADVWTMDGRHINSLLKKEGHVLATEDYSSELAKDILTAAAEDSKKDQYKKLEEALKENEEDKKRQRKESQDATQKQRLEEEAAVTEPLSTGGWIGLIVVAVLVLGVATNFGRGSNKKTNLNRKRGFFERMFMKLKGA